MMLKRSQTLLVLLLLLTLTVPGVLLAESISGAVKGVSDGDTIKVMDSHRTMHKIRLWGIDAPEKRQAYGKQAKKAMSDLCYDKQVYVEVVDTDRYGRKIGIVWLPGAIQVNRRLVEDGWAWWYQRYAKKALSLRDAQEEARKAKKGLWIDGKPIAPWEWRKLRRNRSK